VNREKYGFGLLSVDKSENNPERHKHLEAATTGVLGPDIDFVC